MTKYKVGDRVRVNGKDGASDNIVGKTFTITEVRDWEETYKYRLSGNASSVGFCEKEIDLVTRKEDIVRRTFRLLKDTPDFKKGLLVQEACDDGDQEYISLNGDNKVKFDDYEEFFDDNEIKFSRQTVEDNPSWFVEVFALGDDGYVTEDELNGYKKFKLALKKKTTKRK